MIAKFLREQNFNPVILIRGYKAQRCERTAGTKISDEAEMLKKSLTAVPVLVGADRVANARAALEGKTMVDVFLLDDGFQHFPIQRDLDIVAIDAVNPFGNRWLIPAGILREPLQALARAKIFVITKSDIGQKNIPAIRQEILKNNPQAWIAEAVHQPEFLESLTGKETIALSQLRGKKVCSLCSIGSPQSFAATLESLGAELQKSFAFMDHHWYARAELEEIFAYCQSQQINWIVTTAKDAVKLTRLREIPAPVQILVLNIHLKIVKGQDEFFNRILAILQR